MNHLIRGQKLKLSDILDSSAPFFLNLQLDAATLSCDVASFGLDADYRLSDDAYMTFYNQPQTPCGGVIWASTHSQQSTTKVLPLLPVVAPAISSSFAVIRKIIST